MGEICPPAYSGGTGHSVNACGGETLSDFEKYFKKILIIQNMFYDIIFNIKLSV